jgi:hypothetical protein
MADFLEICSLWFVVKLPIMKSKTSAYAPRMPGSNVSSPKGKGQRLRERQAKAIKPLCRLMSVSGLVRGVLQAEMPVSSMATLERKQNDSRIFISNKSLVDNT